MLLREQRNSKRKAELSGRKKHISGDNVALEPTGCCQDPEGLDVAFGCGRDRVRRGYRTGDTPTQVSYLRWGPLGSCSSDQHCRDRQLLQRRACGERLHSQGYTSWCVLVTAHISYGPDADSCNSSARGTGSIRCNMTWQCRKKPVQVFFRIFH